MNKTVILSLFLISTSIQAQFIGKEEPTNFELNLNNTNNVNLLYRNASAAKANKDFVGMLKIVKKLNKLTPNIPSIKYMLAEAYALNGEKSSAFNALVELQKLGMYYDIGNNKSFNEISKFPVFEYIKGNFDANNLHFGSGLETFKIDKSFSGLLFESLAIDQKNLAFLMGSLRDGRIIKIDEKGEITTLIEETLGGKQGPWAVMDLAIDNNNDTLWVASASVSQYGKMSKQSAGLSGVFKYQLSTGELLKSYVLPAHFRPAMISSMHLTKEGDLFLLESQQGLVLKFEKETEKLTKVFSTKENKNLRSITADESGRMVYIAGSEKGIVIVDTEKQTSYLIENTAAINLVGISNITYDDNGLIIVQNVNNPERIMRLELNKTKTVISNIFPIESSHPRFNSPSVAVVFDQGLYFIANSQTTKTNNYGGLLKGQEWQDQYILSTNKHYHEQETIEYNKKIAKEKKRTGSK